MSIELLPEDKEAYNLYMEKIDFPQWANIDDIVENYISIQSHADKVSIFDAAYNNYVDIVQTITLYT